MTTFASDQLPTASFRAEHAEVKEHLRHIDSMAGSLPSQDEAKRAKTAGFIVEFLTDHILTHAAWEEKNLYPAVDKRTTAGARPFTGTMRYEHGIIGRRIADLRSAASGSGFDAARFVRDTDRLLGLIAAHFEKEEEVLLPVLDESMTREQVESELGMADSEHH
ncbi:MAG TPA: hemerythrin domain-containing protein [Thermoanaerobaculia bacterium]